MFLPLDLVAKSVGSVVTVFLAHQHEAEGTLVAFDSTCNLVLENARHYVETVVTAGDSSQGAPHHGEPLRQKRLLVGRYRRMLVNSHHVYMIVPGGVNPDAAVQPSSVM